MEREGAGEERKRWRRGRAKRSVGGPEAEERQRQGGGVVAPPMVFGVLWEFDNDMLKEKANFIVLIYFDSTNQSI